MRIGKTFNGAHVNIIDGLKLTDISGYLRTWEQPFTTGNQKVIPVAGRKYDAEVVDVPAYTDFGGLITGNYYLYAGSTQSIADTETDILTLSGLANYNVLHFNRLIIVIQIITIAGHSITMSWQERDLDNPANFHTIAGDSTAALVATGHTKLIITAPVYNGRISVTCAGGAGNATYRVYLEGKTA